MSIANLAGTMREREYVKLKKRLKIAKIVYITCWLGGVQFFLVTEFVFSGLAAMPGAVVQRHYYLEKGSWKKEVSASQFWLSRISGITFAACFLPGAITMIYADSLEHQVVKKRPTESVAG